MLKISLAQMDTFFRAVASLRKLYIPVDNEGGARWEPWAEGKTWSSALNTNRSAKDFFFPQTENLYNLNLNGHTVEVTDIRDEHEDFVIFGVRACDVRSFSILDMVFLSEPVDTYYKNRREHSLIVSVACTAPAHTCFCRQMGIDASDPEGDVVCWLSGDTLYLEAKTGKGEDFLKTAGEACPALSDAGGTAEADKAKAEIRSALDALQPLFPAETGVFSEENLKAVFYSPLWAELSEACLGCGTCTFVCPTCQCYDIRDFDTGSGVRRFRCWDSCMYSDFTKMSAGQPRPTQLERFRQRFMHKLVYFPANNDGVYGCVGCGRCLAKCPISMNIVKVARALAAGVPAKKEGN